MELVIIFCAPFLGVWSFITPLISTSMYRMPILVSLYVHCILCKSDFLASYRKVTNGCWMCRCVSRHPAASLLEDWISTKDCQQKEQSLIPKWHIPTNDELLFANELLDLHFQSALDDLLRICQNKVHSDLGKLHICSQ